jgi:uncharacterized protein YqgC (DUF456 family)
MSTNNLMLPSLIGMLVTYGGMFIFLPYFGIVAAPLASAFGGLTAIIVICVGNCRTDYSMRFSLKALLPVLCFVLLISLLSVCFKPYLLQHLGAGAHPVWIALVAVLLGLSAWWLWWKINLNDKK